MPKRISSSEFITILTTHGFEFLFKRGSHAKYRDAYNKGRAFVRVTLFADQQQLP